jgi:uncharacterized membrane protein YphA (DoxX/SURF4 family)
MAHQTGSPKSGRSEEALAGGLMIVRVTAGIYLFFVGLHKISWLLDSTPLVNQLSSWLSESTPINRWYLERLMPGTPLFARLVPLGEMLGGLALLAGFWTRMAAGCAFLMVLNFQLAQGVMFHYAYLTDATGLPYIGALLGLTIGGGRLPLSIRK